jgi:sialate O-acetylesterase
MKLQKPLCLLGLVLGVVTASPARAEVSVPSFFSDHMVLQRDADVPVWGWAEPGKRSR